MIRYTRITGVGVCRLGIRLGDLLAGIIYKITVRHACTRTCIRESCERTVLSDPSNRNRENESVCVSHMRRFGQVSFSRR